jgi:signal peptidase II
MKKKYLILLGVCGVLVFLDQATKVLVYSRIELGQDIPIIPNFFSLTYVRNPGAAFGMLRDAHDGFRNIFFLLVPPIALVFILAILRGVKDTDLVSILSLSAIAGGAIGNFIDRIRFGYVVDFLDFYLPEGFLPLSSLNSSWADYPAGRSLHWPAFNVADMAIVCGAIMLLLIEVKRYRDEVLAHKKQA